MQKDSGTEKRPAAFIHLLYIYVLIVSKWENDTTTVARNNADYTASK